MIETERSGVMDRWWKEGQGMEISTVNARYRLHWLVMACNIQMAMAVAMAMALVLEGG